MRRRRLATALGASVAIHVVAVVALRVRAPLTPVPAPEVPVQVELVVEPPVEADPDPTASQPDESPKAQPPTRPTPSPRMRQRPQVADADVASREAAPVAAPAPPPAAASAPPPDLSLSLDRVANLEADGVLSPLPSAAREAIGRVHPSHDDRIAQIRRRDEGRAIVERGRAHPYFFDLARDARAAVRSLKPDELEGLASGAYPQRAFVHRFVSGYSRIVGAAQEGRSAEQEQLAPPGAPLVLPDARDRPQDVLAGYNVLMDISAAMGTRLTTDVCVVVEPGQEPRIDVAKGSGHPRFDLVAKAYVAAAMARRPLAAGVAATRACYIFDLTSSRVPPVPMVGCAFDESAGELSCYWPLKKMVKLRLRLDSTEPLGSSQR